VSGAQADVDRAARFDPTVINDLDGDLRARRRRGRHSLMRLLRLIARLNVGGPARHVVWQNEGLAANGFDSLLVTGTVPEGEQDMTEFAIARGVTPLVLPSMSRELSPRDLRTIWQVWRLMVRFRPHIVHTH